MKLKAEFPNANLQLWPGQFVNVRLLIDTLQQVVVVPTAAVQRGPTGTFVYRRRRGRQRSAVRPVTVTQQDDVQAVIASGLQAGERVVTTGFARLADGTRGRRRRAPRTAGQPPPPTGAAPAGSDGKARPAPQSAASGDRRASRRRQRRAGKGAA